MKNFDNEFVLIEAISELFDAEKFSDAFHTS